MKEIKRCSWCNTKNHLYVEYHDNEWCNTNFDERNLYEMLILESFQAGLSWECILNKRENFRIAYDNFDLEKVCLYDENKIKELINNKDIIRNKLKIRASVDNSKIFKSILSEFGSFYKYLISFTNGVIIYETDKTTNEKINLSNCYFSSGDVYTIVRISKEIKDFYSKYLGKNSIPSAEEARMKSLMTEYTAIHKKSCR